MALKKRINASEYAVLDDELKQFYIKDGSGYKVDLEGDEGVTQADVDAAVQAKNHEKQKRQEAERRLRELEQSGGQAGEEAETLRTQLKELSERLNNRDEAIKRSAKERIAAEITTHAKTPKVLLPHVMSRLSADLDEQGNAVVSILGADGKPSKMTTSELVEEFRKTEDFQALMLAPTSSGGNGGEPNGGGEVTKKLSEMSEKERVALAKSDPEAFKKLTADATAA